MGRKSVRENKNAYQLRREELGLSREKAAQLLDGITEDRLERIETKNFKPQPEEVLEMARKYKDSSLCNYFCTTECKIGQLHSIKVEIKDLSTIVLQTIASLNSLEKKKDRFIEIASDSMVDETEMADFNDIREGLNRISASVEALRLWSEQMAFEADADGQHA